MRGARTVVASLALVTLMAVVALAAGCGDGDADGGGGPTSPSASTAPSGSTGKGAGKFVPVSIGPSGFTPATLNVKTGTTVVWTNTDVEAHTVTATDGPGTEATPTGAFASVDLPEGGTFQYMFDSPGVYYYACSIHASRPAMHAQVIVTE